MTNEVRRAWLFDFGEGLRAIASGQHLAEYLRAPKIIEVPLMPTHARGVLVWREKLVPLIDLARLAGSDSEASEEAFGVIVLAYRESPQSPLSYGALTLATAPSEIEVNDAMACDLPTEPVFWGAIASACISYADHALPILRVRNIFSQALATAPFQ